MINNIKSAFTKKIQVLEFKDYRLFDYRLSDSPSPIFKQPKLFFKIAPYFSKELRIKASNLSHCTRIYKYI